MLAGKTTGWNFNPLKIAFPVEVEDQEPKYPEVYGKMPNGDLVLLKATEDGHACAHVASMAPEVIEAIARRVVELLDGTDGPTQTLVEEVL